MAEIRTKKTTEARIKENTETLKQWNERVD